MEEHEGGLVYATSKLIHPKYKRQKKQSRRTTGKDMNDAPYHISDIDLLEMTTRMEEIEGTKIKINYNSGYSSSGLAPAVALAWITIQEMLEKYGIIDFKFVKFEWNEGMTIISLLVLLLILLLLYLFRKNSGIEV